MKNGVKKELAIALGLGAINCLLRRSNKSAALLSVASAGLLFSSSSSNYSFKGKTVFITGGSRGLGYALAAKFLRDGAKVTIVARKQEELEKAQNRLAQLHPDASVYAITCDVTNRAQLSHAIHDSIKRYGQIDILVNNAGAISVGPFASMDKADFEAQMNLHLYAILDSTKLIVPHFRERGVGRIVNICSLGGKVAVPHMLPYDTSKFALAGFSQGITAELAAENIHVTTVYPTVMRTGSPIQAVFKGDHEKEFAWFQSADVMPGISMSADDAADRILQAVQNGDTEVILSAAAKMRMLVATVFPELASLAMATVARIMPNGTSRVRKTGAQSRALFDEMTLTKPLQKAAHKAEADYNQSPSENADFNMGLH